MSQIHQNAIWQVRLPDGWSVSPLRFEGAVIYKPDGIGQIHVMVRPDDPELKSVRFNEGGHHEFSGKLRGLTYQWTHGKTFSQTWHLFCGDRTIYVHYSCAAVHTGVERDDVDRIVGLIENADRSQGPAVD